MNRWSVRHRIGLAGVAAVTVLAVAWPADPAYADAFDSVRRLLDHAIHIVDRSYRRSPAAIAVAAAGLALPLLGLVMLIARRIARAIARHRTTPAYLAAPSPQAGTAWLELDGATHRRMHLRAELSRIGRDADNDLTVTGPGIAATHAIIQRTPERDYLVVDVSGDIDPGLTVNGARCRHATLVDGDRIAFGPAAVTFRNGGPGNSGSIASHPSTY